LFGSILLYYNKPRLASSEWQVFYDNRGQESVTQGRFENALDVTWSQPKCPFSADKSITHQFSSISLSSRPISSKIKEDLVSTSNYTMECPKFGTKTVNSNFKPQQDFASPNGHE
jgi:hypothetical protein